MYLIRGISFQYGSKIGDMVLEKKIYACNLYETWEVKIFEKDHFSPYTAHIFKYSLTGMFPLHQKELDAFCLNALETSYHLKERNLDIRVNPCHNNKAYQILTNDNVLLSYMLFERPDGGYKLSDACNSTCVKDRVCRYSLKNLAKGLLRVYQLSDSCNSKYCLNYLLLKNVLYYGKFPHIPHVEVNLNEKYNPITKFQTSINNFQKSDDKKDFKNYFIIIPFPKYFKPEDYNQVNQHSNSNNVIGKLNNALSSGLSDNQNTQVNDNNSQLAKIRMVQIGNLLSKVYDGLDEAEDVQVYQPGDNFSPDNKIQNMDYVDLFYQFNKEEIHDFEVRKDEYFGIKQDFANLFTRQANPTITVIKQNNNLLQKSFYEFLLKLLNFYGDQFKSYEEAINHKFLSGKVYLSHIESDTGDVSN